MSAKRCERDLRRHEVPSPLGNPQSACTDHRFFPFGDYALRLVATGPLPVAASQRNTQDGALDVQWTSVLPAGHEERRPKRSGDRTRKPVGAHESESCPFTNFAPGYKVRENGLEPLTLCIWSRYVFQSHHSCASAPGEIRTHTGS